MRAMATLHGILSSEFVAWQLHRWCSSARTAPRCGTQPKFDNVAVQRASSCHVIRTAVYGSTSQLSS